MAHVIFVVTKIGNWESSLIADGVSFPECPYFCKCDLVDGLCSHPFMRSSRYCSNLNRKNYSPDSVRCPFDLHEELYDCRGEYIPVRNLVNESQRIYPQCGYSHLAYDAHNDINLLECKHPLRVMEFCGNMNPVNEKSRCPSVLLRERENG